MVGAAPSVLGDIPIGLRACLAHPLIGPALIADSVMGFFSGFFFALYMLLALEALVLPPRRSASSSVSAGSGPSSAP